MSEVQKIIVKITEKINTLLGVALEFLFPLNCMGCGEKHMPLCNQCILKCDRAENFSIQWIESVFSYKDPIIRKILWNIKYKGDTTAINVLGNALYDVIISKIYGDVLFEKTSCYKIIPIPISKKDLKKRGYNQSELLARAMCKNDLSGIFNIETTVLCKNKNIKKQMSVKNKVGRKKNINGCFSIRNNILIKNQEIILIDDIVTTGATLTEAKNVLLSAGAKKVLGFTIAH